MKPFYQDNHITGLYNKDCRDMPELQDNSVQCVVTSPPYWGLRKYSGEQDLIWGPADCNHQWQPDTIKHDNLRFRGEHSIVGNERNRGIHPVESWKDCEHNFSIPTPPRRSRAEKDCPNPNTISAGSKGSYYNAEGGNTCSLCGAWKGAFGLEPTPEMYIQHTIEILREIRRVLRKDGVVFWNIGDSYCGYWGDKKALAEDRPSLADGHGFSMNSRPKYDQFRSSGLKPKDLCLIPFRLAIACQEDGWWVRSVIIWSKPNPMPESVTDRPTESHEYILMLTKSAKYYWDADAVRTKTGNEASQEEYAQADGRRHFHKADLTEGMSQPANPAYRAMTNPAGRNIRTVWEFPTQPYPEAHFAVFPEKLPEICIKAATPEVGCCSKCGSPWERVTEVDYIPAGGRGIEKTLTEEAKQSGQAPGPQGYKYGRANKSVTTKGWQPTCKCNADKVPSLVLDPFAGAGTTLWVAKKLNRRAVGYEISEEYCRLTLERNRQLVLTL